MRVMDINLKGVLYGIAAALPIMQKQRRGHIINIALTAGRRVPLTMTVYSATKFGVRAISEGLRRKAAVYNIRGTDISPGPTGTGLPDSVTEPDVAASVPEQHPIAIPPLSMAQAIAFAIEQPDEVDVKEIVVRPTALA